MDPIEKIANLIKEEEFAGAIDDVSGSISEDATGFKIIRIYTDKFIYDEGFGAGEIFNLIEEAKQPGMNVSYIDGEAFASHTNTPQPQPEVAGTLPDQDEFSRDDLCNVMVFYTGTVSEEDLVQVLIKIFRDDYGLGDDWLDALTYE